MVGLLAFTLFAQSVMAVEKGETEIVASNGIVNIDNNHKPFNENGRILVPLRYTSELFNALTSFDTETQTMTIRTVGGGNVEFTVGSNIYKNNGKPIEMDIAPDQRIADIYIPIRYALEALGYNVGWHSKSSTAYIDGEVNSTQDYEAYAYGFNGDSKLGHVKFRTKLEAGLQVLPGTQTKGEGNSLIEFYYNKDDDMHEYYDAESGVELTMYLEQIKEILQDQKVIKFENVRKAFMEEKSNQADGIAYIFDETPSHIKVVRVVSDTVKTDIQGVKVKANQKEVDYQGLGAVTRNENGTERVYVPLIETARLAGETELNKWGQKIVYESGIEIDLTKIDSHIIHGNTYIPLEDFNKIFKNYQLQK